MTVALIRASDGLEIPVIQRDLYAESCVMLFGSQGIIDSLTQEQLISFGRMPDGPTQEIGKTPDQR
jgi:hypothetical protein